MDKSHNAQLQTQKNLHCAIPFIGRSETGTASLLCEKSG